MRKPNAAPAYRDIRRLFDEAVDLTGEQRRVFLDEQCASDAVLRAAVVELLAAHDAADGFLNDSHATFISGVVRAPLPVPEQIGSYRILRECGRGGMGSVYEAEQESPRRRVALKVVRSGSMSRDVLRRLRHEAEILGQLQHPGIARVFEAGSFDLGEGGQPYFAMEFIDGRSICTHASEKGLNTARRLELFALVCDAVHYAHQRGVIHRDLKPDNILVEAATNAGAIGQPKVLDFGIARATNSDMQITTMQTDAGILMGTLQYMSPEQAAGRAHDLDLRTDIYALGVILYEMLTGRTPHDLSERSLPESIMAIRDEPPSRLGSHDSAYRGDLETIVGKCIEKEPDQRYQSAMALAEDVRRYLKHEPILARRPSTWYQLRKFGRRNKTLVAGIIGIFLALILGVVGMAVFAIESGRNAAAATWESYQARISAASAQIESDPAVATRLLEDAPPIHRGWEWDYLVARTMQYRTFAARSTPTGAIALASDGRRLVGALQDGSCAVWDIESGDVLDTIEIGAPINELSLPLDGPPLLAVSDIDGRVRIIDLDRRTLIDEFSLEHRARLQWDWSGRRLGFTTGVSVGMRIDGTLHNLGESPANREQFALGFSRDGKRFHTFLREGTWFQTWNTETLKQLPETTWIADESAMSIASSPDGRYLAVGTNQYALCVLDADTYQLLHRYLGHRATVRNVAYDRTGHRVASSSVDRTARVWDARTGAELATVQSGRGSQIAFDATGQGLFVGMPTEIRLWDLSPEAAFVLRGHKTYVYYLDYSSDGSMLVTGAFNGKQALVWDAYTRELVGSIPTRGQTTIGFGPGDTTIVVAGTYYDLATGTELARSSLATDAEHYRALRGTIGIGFSADGSLMSKCEDRNGSSLTVSRILGDETLFVAEGSYWGSTFSADGHLVAATNGTHQETQGPVRIWDAQTFDLVAELPGHHGRAFGVDFHPDGTRLATGGDDGLVKIWDTASWKLIHELRGHTGYVKGVRFSPDGTQLASVSGDFTVRLWDTRTTDERHQQHRQGIQRRAAQRELVDALLVELSDGDAVSAALRENDSLTPQECVAALRVLRERLQAETPDE